jgi:hypothetical protein
MVYLYVDYVSIDNGKKFIQEIIKMYRIIFLYETIVERTLSKIILREKHYTKS